MADISLEQASERAHQAEIICRMLESYPDEMDATEIIAIATLLKKLTGDVAAWLIEELSIREKSN
ncbi:hypothetical protein [Serratia marcescens]|uniref:hypothetical protein n=1 Tax=Serratia marcescens TaxID=615 RepID=UPI000E2C7AE8|nr:hypothetical protein [Serratia marcescens]